MKTQKLLILLVFVIALSSPFKGAAQKVAEKVTTSTTLVDDDGEPHTFEGEGIEVKNNSGNFLRTAQVKVPKDILEKFTFEPYANIWTIAIFKIDTDGDGNFETEVIDSKAFLNKSGHLSVTFHINGAGFISPKW